MWSQIFLGCFLVLVTTVVHGVATGVALIVLKNAGRLMHWDKTSHVQRPILVGALVVALFLVSVLDAVMWAHVYLRVGAIEQLETALYLSMVTFTTLGYGDVTLPDDWRERAFHTRQRSCLQLRVECPRPRMSPPFWGARPGA